MEHMEVRDSPGKGLFSTNTYGFYKRNLSHFSITYGTPIFFMAI